VASVIHMRGNYIAELLSSWRGRDILLKGELGLWNCFLPSRKREEGVEGGRMNNYKAGNLEFRNTFFLSLCGSNQ